MKDLFHVLQAIAPEALTYLQERYEILVAIQFSQPVGRRTLAERLKINEGVLRRHLESMHQWGLLHVSTAGVALTEKATEVMTMVEPLLREALGLTRLEKLLAERLNLRRVIAVPGDSDLEDAVKLSIGKAAATIVRDALKTDSTIAVMGGLTVASVTQMISGHYPDVTVVPARGGLGEKVEIQANTIAAKMADQLGGQYKLLHIPENLDQVALETMLSNPRIQRVLSMIQHADIMLYGIGRIDIMVSRRSLSSLEKARLRTKGAVAEALGNYYNQKGEVVERAASLGFEASQQPNLSLSLAVAGGSTKAQAIVAALRQTQGQELVTDEGAARQMALLLEL